MNFGTLVLEAAAGGTDPDVRKFKLNGYTGGKVSLPGLNHKAVFDLKTMFKADGQLPLILDHDFRQPVGHSADVKISETSVTGTGITSVPGPWRTTVLAAAANQFVWQLSVGGTAEAYDITLITCVTIMITSVLMPDSPRHP